VGGRVTGAPPRRGVAAAALAADVLLGEPPAPLHPTVWMGRWIGGCRERRCSRAPLPSLLEGALGVAAGAAASALAAGALDRVLLRLPHTAGVVARGAALKPALSLRALLAAGAEVERALAAGRLDESRRALGWHLVSRDTAALDAAEVAGATVESLAENLGDGVVAPLLAFRAGGLAGAYLYRFLNTADAMLGYRTLELEWFGKAAARADDVANLLPARLTALLVAAAAPLGGGSPAAALRCALADARRASSPNAGWPMAAMAGALGTRLTKRGVYELNASGREPGWADIARARRIVAGAAVLAAGVAR
jgi:adenosylcobinamide-phosphate synthase